jgi:hypothetical protein
VWCPSASPISQYLVFFHLQWKPHLGFSWSSSWLDPIIKHGIKIHSGIKVNFSHLCSNSKTFARAGRKHMHQTYGANREQPLALSWPETVSPLRREALSSLENERGPTIAATVVNQHTGTPILFTWKTSQFEKKNHGPKLPKSSSSIIKWEYNKFCSREH